jgi:GT2 family glycosyltransferase
MKSADRIPPPSTRPKECTRHLTFSVIIPTKNRPDDLDLAVQSLFRQTTIPRGLVIVDQSETAESERRIEQLCGEAPERIRTSVSLSYIRDRAIAGSSAARNRAMEVAQGDIWVFLDDDVELEENFLEELLDVYRRYPDVDGVSGIITNYQTPPWIYHVWTRTFFRGPFFDERQPVYWNAEKLRSHEPISVGKFGGGVMSFRAQTIRGMQFDENLHGVSDGEDVDFCVRLRPGALLMIAPRARLCHKQSPIGRSSAHPIKRLAQANCYLYKKHWQDKFLNRLHFGWLIAGLGLAVSVASVRRVSLEPWRTLIEGIREGARVSVKNPEG